MIAEIKWLSAKRFIPDIGVKYCPIIMFSHELTYSWSAEVIIIKNDTDNRKSIADITYLFSNAPQNNICKGKKFILLEGNREVAYGKFIDDNLTASTYSEP